jgi:metallo-beta-lactamase class B
MADFNRFGNMTPPKDTFEKPYLLAVDPFKIVGNLYYVGNAMCSTHLIDTGEGLIIIDTPVGGGLPYLIDSIRRLGFDPRDIKYIIVSHAHMDHYAVVNALVHMSGAKTLMGELDAKDMIERRDFFEKHTKLAGAFSEMFTTDIFVKDGDYIELGNTKIRCVLTPGHTVGTMSHFWEVEDEGEIYKVGLYGGAGFVTLSPKWIEEQGGNLDETRKMFLESINKVWDEPVDIMLGNHPFHSDILAKNKRKIAGEKNAFIDPTEWKRFLQELKDRFTEFSKMTQEEIDEMYRKDTGGFEIYANTFK